MADFLSGYNDQTQRNQQADMGALQQAGVLQGILSKVRAEKELKDFQAELAAADTPQKKLDVAMKRGAPKEVMTVLQGSMDRQATRDNTKQIAMQRLSQQFQRDTADIAYKARTATTQEEKFHWQQQMDTLKASATKQAADIAAGRYTYDTGGAVAPFQGTVPQAGAAAPTSQASDQPATFNFRQPSGQVLSGSAPSEASAVGIGQAALGMGPQGALSQIAAASAPQAQPEPSYAPVQPNNLDARDLGAGARGPVMGTTPAPAAAPATPQAPAQATAPAPVMPQFSGAPREVARAQNEWRMAQAKAANKKANEINLSGGRESQQNNRIISAGNQVAAALRNIAEIPIAGASTGIFGERGQSKGILNAGKETIANAMTTQEVNDYKIMATGIERSLAAIESSGLAATGQLTSQMGSVIWREGWTNFSKLRALAETRQIVEKGMEVQLANPRVPPETKELVRKIVNEVQTTVPFTHADLTKLQAEQAINPNITLADVVKAVGPKRRAGDKPKAEDFFR